MRKIQYEVQVVFETRSGDPAIETDVPVILTYVVTAGSVRDAQRAAIVQFLETHPGSVVPLVLRTRRLGQAG